MIKIANKHSMLCAFGKLRQGDTFSYNDSYYIRCEDVLVNDCIYNAVNLLTGSLWRMSDSDCVIKTDLECKEI